ncbi:glycosyltransferase family 9 protein [Polynucleobacter sp. AP-Sanab-80-C2]|uniref:glycosyltransferase family 9 protein n=1 Tax=unclassified Polynucleobacter TaxID=2640945 RepID=UPI001BFE28F5|nr:MULTISPECIES: glycosyltransferase family 9 protein [unclassified Polynucleobacter]MEA9599394.1 glycosyltransferase family 9 protein [Polynucleobacter sp. AP-Sanab-80-C2]QWE05962.1 glycosyltransferase family 9 protein [Polynucleobacter sp. JS-JIR-5-A7]
MTISVNTMRAIDHWVGVPLCAIASPLVVLIDGVKRIFSRGPKTPKKLLFIELSEMGSAILVDPAMRNAQARGAELFFLIFKSNRASLTLLNTVKPENIFTIDSSSLGGLIKDTLRFLLVARAHRIDTVIDLELFSRFTALLTGLCGARHRVGYHIFHGEGLWRGFMLTRKVHYNPHIHITKNFLSLIHAAFAKEIEVPFSKIQIPDSEVKLEQAIIHPDVMKKVLARIEKKAAEAGIPYTYGKNRLILINPNASDLLPQRRWAQQRFSELIQAVNQRYPNDLILITGSPTEFVYVDKVRSVANVKNALNFAGQVTFTELPPLYTLSDVMVTNDSGPGHFSAVTPLRTVVLFGPETPALYGSIGNSIAITANLACSPCVSAANHRKTPCQDNVCMQAISVAQVLDKVTVQLQEADRAKGRSAG